MGVPVSMGAFEARLVALERRVFRLPALPLERRVAALEQALWQGWSWQAPQQAGSPTAVSGAVLGCGNFALAGAVVRFAAGGQPIGQLTADACGTYAGLVTLPEPTTTVQVTATADAQTDPHAARFGASSPITVTLTGGQPSPIPTLTVPAAAGFHCSQLVSYPLPDVLHLTDSRNGAFVLTWDTTRNTWFLQTALAYAGCPARGCAGSGASKVVYGYQIFNGGTLQGFYGYNTASGNCPTAFSNSTQVDFALALTVPSTSPFQAGATLAAGNGSRWYCGGAANYTLTE
jgi:hypothetical protein